MGKRTSSGGFLSFGDVGVINVSGLTWLDFFVRCVPEGFLYMLMGYAFAGRRVRAKAFAISGLLLAVWGYLARLLPTIYGAAQILILMGCVFLLVFVNRIPIKVSVFASVSVMALTVACEAINMLLLDKVLGYDAEKLLSSADIWARALSGLPSLVLLTAAVVSTYIVRTRRKADHT